MRVRDNDYELTREIYKGLSFTRYTGKAIKNENDILRMKNIINDLGYTSVGDKPSKRKAFFTMTLPKTFEEI